jgi:hypothetical protein
MKCHLSYLPNLTTTQGGFVFTHTKIYLSTDVRNIILFDSEMMLESLFYIPSDIFHNIYAYKTIKRRLQLL